MHPHCTPAGPAIEHMYLYENTWTDEMVARYHRDFAVRDLWTIAPLSDPRFDTFVRMTELVSPQTYASSPLWTELLRPNGDDTFYALGLKTRLASGLGGITFYRRETQSDFRENELRELRQDEQVLARLIGIWATIARGASEARSWRAVVDSYAGEIYVVAPNSAFSIAMLLLKRDSKQATVFAWREENCGPFLHHLANNSKSSRNAPCRMSAQAGLNLLMRMTN